ncbi:YdeI/OmpD-associated family protein [Lysinibacillus sp. BW-2-10]|uniref:YdeI/OmpD-associated family protein n=1 Tax=Lysinibacillus sp. BW-2-10 TaxID=2590030 RepID=UPI00117D9AF8|nr:YdeI/OmpD-associated family protein [Lysinibacillus sp. BW-2-10]TSI11014.1 YdeI/OmpD-associated family protein [Lysinibacillus sp. BW-2-10]
MANSIVEKLKLIKYKEIAILNIPKDSYYFDELPHYDSELHSKTYDLIFVFVLYMESLQNVVNKIIKENYLNPKGYIYLAYPKKGNKVYDTFIHRDDLLEGLGADQDGYIGNSTIKFARMVGLDDVFTVVGLKEDAKSKNTPSTKMSQCVDDYIELIPQIEKDLAEAPKLLKFYQSLTPGYRKDWARYVYSAKQEVTKAKRREEMKEILALGFKTRDLYKLGKK